MVEIITRHEAIRRSPAFQRLLTRVTAIAVLKNADRFEYRNTVHNDTWIFWKINGHIVASAIIGESAASIHVKQEVNRRESVNDDIIYNDGEALALMHFGALVETSEGKDSGTWAVGLLPPRGIIK